MSTSCCGTGCGCSSEPTLLVSEIPGAAVNQRQWNIEFMYLDLDVCDRCQGSEANLDQALADVTAILAATGVKVTLQKTHIQSLEQALALGFVSSPTIRVNGRDIQFDIKENACPSCSELSGTATNCRVWVYQGQEYSVAPKAMIIEALLRHIYGGSMEDVTKTSRPDSQVENLRQFFKAKQRPEMVISGDLTPSDGSCAVHQSCGCN